MEKLTHNDLLSLESYAVSRHQFRDDVMQYKKHRQVMLGENARLCFEDKKTIQYQIQEMLRIEKIFESQGIQDELDTYNPLIPDGRNWKATFMLEYSDIDERRKKVNELVGIEKKIWVQVDNFVRVYAIADEDLERADGEKTSTVHFLRFELSSMMVSALKQGDSLKMGIDHQHYQVEINVADDVRESITADLDDVIA